MCFDAKAPIYFPMFSQFILFICFNLLKIWWPSSRPKQKREKLVTAKKYFLIVSVHDICKYKEDDYGNHIYHTQSVLYQLQLKEMICDGDCSKKILDSFSSSIKDIFLTNSV